MSLGVAIEAGAEWMAIVIPFGLVLCRLSGVALGLPSIFVEVAPWQLRGVAVFLFAVLFTSVAPPVAYETVSIFAFAGELLFGLGLGLLVRLATLAAALGAEVAGYQLGFGFGASVDPLSQESAGPLTRLTTATVGLLIFTTGAYREILAAFVASLQRVRLGAVALDTNAIETLVGYGAEIFSSGLRIAAPLLITTFATQMTFGLLTRVAPQLNLWSIGFLATIGAGLVSLTLFAPSFVSEIARLVHEGVDRLVWGLGG